MTAYNEDIAETISLSDPMLTGIAVTLSDGVATVETYIGGFGTSMADGISLHDAFSSRFGKTIREQIGLLGNWGGGLNVTALINEQIALRERINTGIAVALAEGIAATDTFADTLALLGLITETLQVQDSTVPAISISASVAISLAVADTLLIGASAQINESIALEDVFIDKLALYAQIAEAMQIADSLSAGLSVFALIDESISIVDTPSPAISISALIEEGVTVALAFALDGLSVVGWVTNAEGAYPSSRYDNVPFNSLANVDGTLYALGSDGLYALDADDDNGEAIVAEIVTGLNDFGTDLHKRIDSINVGFTSDGTMLAKVRTVLGGRSYEDWYRMIPRTANAPREGIIKIGKGLKSRYWQFVLSNQDGADFALSDITWHPIVLSRRR